jgi:23S rRNA (cytidine2498-2'-O)-methyltransferase
LQVVAVDPADLHPSIVDDPAVTHVRTLAHDYLNGPGAGRLFDVILNDMRMDARDSARLMAATADRLQADGLAVVTLKLPTRRMDQVAAHALNLLRERYRILNARQLFHNRHEITVALSGRGWRGAES